MFVKWLKNRVGQGFIFPAIVALLHTVFFGKYFISQNKKPLVFSVLESKLCYSKKVTKNGGIYQHL